MDKLIITYDNLLLLGDYNCEPSESCMNDFLGTYNLTNLVIEPTCFKNINKPTIIDLILTNKKSAFQNTKVFETGLSDFHKMTITVFKVSFQKQPPNLITYRNYKNFNSEYFCNELSLKLENRVMVDLNYDSFKYIFMKCLNKHAPVKKKMFKGK